MAIQGRNILSSESGAAVRPKAKQAEASKRNTARSSVASGSRGGGRGGGKGRGRGRGNGTKSELNGIAKKRGKRK